MFSPLSQSAFVRHFDLCKSRIKHEMYLTVDNMVDRVYDQALTDLHQFASLDQTRLNGQRMSSFPFSCHNQSTTFIPPNVTHLTNISPTSHHLTHQHITTHHSPPPLTEPIPIDPLSTRQSFPTSPVPPPPVSIANVQFRKMSTENEIETTAMSPVQSQPPPPSLSSSMDNEQSNNNLNDQEICECDECLNGIDIDQQLEDDDDSESVQWIEDELEDGESSRPVKRPKMDTTQPNNATQPEVASQSPRQPNKVHDKQIITLGLQCTEFGCSETFVQNEHYSLVLQFQDHMWNAHSISPFRCFLKDCNQSFDYRHSLSAHIIQAHQHTTRWHCAKCTKNFNSHHQLSVHKYDYHLFGHFKCSYPSCTFTGEYRRKVYSHYALQHKPTLHCQYSGCQYRTPKASNMRKHELVHLGIKPYRCKWPECEYAATQKSYTIVHIRAKHLAPKPGSVPNGAQLDPKDYLEVVSGLL